MSDLEIVGHVSAIPDASELSQALALRVKELAAERARLERELRKTQKALSDLELGLAHDKIAGFMDLTENTSRAA